MAAGHGSALVYSMLEKIGFIKTKDLKEFRQ
jgi:transketolase